MRPGAFIPSSGARPRGTAPRQQGDLPVKSGEESPRWGTFQEIGLRGLPSSRRRFTSVTGQAVSRNARSPALDGVMVAASATSPLTVLGSNSLTAYWRFQRAVVAAQLQAWLPPRGRILVDISGPQSSVASQAAAAGYAVLQVMPRWPAVSERRGLEVPVTFHGPRRAPPPRLSRGR